MKCSLYVSGVRPFNEEDLQSYFSKYGKVTMVKKVIRVKKDFGFIFFDSPIAAERAFYDGIEHTDSDGKSSRQHFINDGSVFVKRRTMEKKEKENENETVSEYINFILLREWI